MNFIERDVKGLTRFLADADLPSDRLRIHISEVSAGERSHPPHSHPGVEAFYMLEGEGTLEIAEERCLIRTNESVVFDATKLHGLINTGAAPMRYIVIISREA